MGDRARAHSTTELVCFIIYIVVVTVQGKHRGAIRNNTDGKSALRSDTEHCNN